MHMFLSPVLIAIASTALAQPYADINTAIYIAGVLPDGSSAITAKLQILMDRNGVSPGVIDGVKGEMSESALRGFESREGFAVDGLIDPQVWTALGGDTATGIMIDYTITKDDVSGLTEYIPDSVLEKFKMQRLGYTRVSERLAERYHMDEDFLKSLNPQMTFARGDTLTVANVGLPVDTAVARIEVRKSSRRAVAFGADGRIIADYPVAIGSTQSPSPQGTVSVTAVAMDPTYTYQPDVNFVADGVTEALILPAGENGPVGSVWIDLSAPTYGLHGTDTPATLFRSESHGCVRFTNWDVEELAQIVSPGVEVTFTE